MSNTPGNNPNGEDRSTESNPSAFAQVQPRGTVGDKENEVINTDQVPSQNPTGVGNVRFQPHGNHPGNMFPQPGVGNFGSQFPIQQYPGNRNLAYQMPTFYPPGVHYNSYQHPVEYPNRMNSVQSQGLFQPQQYESREPPGTDPAPRKESVLLLQAQQKRLDIEEEYYMNNQPVRIRKNRVENEAMRLKKEKEELEKIENPKAKDLKRLQEIRDDLAEAEKDFADLNQEINNLEDEYNKKVQFMERRLKLQLLEEEARKEEQLDTEIENINTGQSSSGGLIVNQLTAALGKAFGGKAGNADSRLPPFTGNPGDWCAFKAAYDRSKKKYKFDPSEDLMRLREALKGQAKDSVSHLMANPSNVSKIMQVLEMRFGRPELVLDYLVEKARASKPVHISQPDAIVEFGTMVDALITNIKSFNQTAYLNDRHLVMELVKKLPPQLQSNWFEWLVTDNTRARDLDNFAVWIQPKVEAALLQVKPKFAGENERTKKTSGVHAAAGPEEVPDKKKCTGCDKSGHDITECRSFKKLSPDQRWEKVKENRLCFTCLKKGHVSPKCKSKLICKEKGCKGKHHTLLHRGKELESNPDEDRMLNERLDALRGAQVSRNSTSSNEEVPVRNLSTALTSGSLPIIPIKVYGPKGIVKAFVLLDKGSNITMIEDELAKQLGVTGTRAPFRFTAFKDQVRDEPNSKKVNVDVSGVFRNASKFELKNVQTVSKLGVPGINLDVESLKEKYPYLRKMKAQSLWNAVPKMLIGYKYMKLMAAREILESDEEDSPSAYKCHLGWYVCDTTEGREAYHIYASNERQDQEMHLMIKDYFSLENFGVKVVKDSHRSKEDKRALEQMEKLTVKKKDRYETCLIWKEDNPSLPESKQMALSRLQSMERKMDRDPEFGKLCNEKFDHYIKSGYLVPRSTNEEEDHGRRWYLPWFIRFHPTKKPRLVFDAAARSHGKCLNDFLLKGPDLLRPLPAVLIRMRRHRIALTADVREMFHQVALRKEDRPSQTLLFRGSDRKSPPIEYEMTVLFFGSSSSPSSAIFTKNLNAGKYEDVYPDAVRATYLDFFMDDFLGGADTEKEALQLHKQLLEIHDAGGFPLVKWNSSSATVLKAITPDLLANGNLNFEKKDDIPMEKALGMYWDPVKDEFGYKLSFARVPDEVIPGERCPTKRRMTSLIMSLFDPLGFIAHFRIKPLIMMQNVWRSQVGWDENIPDAVFEDWKLWLQDLQKIEKLRIPRKLSDGSLKNAVSIQLHAFVDASSEAFSAAVYLRTDTGGRVDIRLVMAKAKVAPIKVQTIPRLELQAAVLGCRLVKAVVEAFDKDLNINKIVYWTDSKTVLCWIRSSTLRYNQFVAARIGEVMELSDVDQWRWVPTKENPADDATRLKSTADLSSGSRFLNGPAFLKDTEQNWPKENYAETAAVSVPEQKAIHVAVKVNEVLLPDADRFSSWYRLIRTTAMRYPFMRRLKKKGPYFITVEDMKKAKRLWIMRSQQDSFPNELKQLRNGEAVSKSSRLYGLSPVLNEDGVIVLGGRIDRAKAADDFRRPPILDQKHLYTKLMVQWFHETSSHFGQERVINELRKSVWIIDCRSAVRRTVKKCLICQYRKAKPVEPEMGQLPLCRLEPGKPPFYYSAVDYFGPLHVKVKRSTVKRWGALFTCLTTRAVHLELVDSLDTSSMINALVRFINLRGPPEHIWSDNGTNFVGAEREMREALQEWNQTQIREELVVRGVQWHFIPPSSPHMGGSWERLVGSTKKVLNNLLKEREPSDEILRTLFAEVMGILNSRPITYVSPDPDDSRCLTPNDLLRVNCVVGGPVTGMYDEADLYRKSWRYGQKLALDFWKRWSSEYLPWLAKRQKWVEKKKPLEVGDIVVVLEDNAPRNMWKKGIITATFPGVDNQVRAVEVKIAHVDPKDPKRIVKTSCLRRPAVKICPLSLQSVETGVPGRENMAEWNGENAN